MSSENESENLQIKELESIEGKVVDLSPLQQAGLKILLFTGSTIAVVILLIFSVSFFGWESEPLPTIPKQPTPPSTNNTQEIENYKIKSDIYKSDLAEYERLVKLKNEKIQIQQDRAVTLFKDIIITGLLPTFTAVLGYIFGSASIENRD